jgi:hypothetical protein
MTAIAQTERSDAPAHHDPAMYPRPADVDEVAAFDCLTRVFGFVGRARSAWAPALSRTLSWRGWTLVMVSS